MVTTYSLEYLKNTLHLPSTTGFTLLAVLLYFPLLNTRSWPLMLLAMVADYIAFGVLAAIFAEPYPTQLRYSGHASAYTFTNLPGGSPTPFVAALLLDWMGSPWSIAGLLAAAYVLSLVLIACTPETKDVDFHGTTGPAHE
ncbi:hypothetical protein [Streptomyces sp. RTd22]|uniref:hypothetical protein n=1 Tax=Streptomyces sp. RTd22 TaxID=1841249 RepID=UPI0007C58D69|nr:hypothetical protein [Streptomyces sp. RTd22]